MSEQEQFTEPSLELGCVHKAAWSLEKRNQTNTAEKGPLAEESRFIELNLESYEEAGSAKMKK